MTKIAVGVRVEETSLNKLDELTKIFGSTRSDLIDTVTGVLTSFDIDFLKTLQGFSKGTRIPEYLIIQNIMASWFARRDAETQVNGYNSPVLNEFLYDGERPMSFEDLYNNLKANYIKDFEREKDEELLRTESFAPEALTDDDRNGIANAHLLLHWKPSLTTFYSSSLDYVQPERKKNHE